MPETSESIKRSTESGDALSDKSEASSLLPPHVPSWVGRLLRDRSADNPSVPPCGLLHGVVASARGLPADALRQAVADLYRQLLCEAHDAGLTHPVRAWNAMPGITEDIESGDSLTERYMAFNAGRHDAFAATLRDFDRDLPAATGVGTVADEDAVRIALLASSEAGVPIGNPKQIPAFRYSERYGKLPPCFARGTLWAGRLLISGTAAITGEDTRFEQDLSAQTQLTLDNLSEVISQARHAGFPGVGLRSLSEVRVYLSPGATGPRDRQAVYQRLRNVSPSARIEFVSVPLCRRNLLVEIEALAVS